MTKFTAFLKDESGATAIEYGLIAAATALGIVAFMPTIKSYLGSIFSDISGGLASVK